MEQSEYYKLENEKRIYYVDNKLIGEKFLVVKYLIAKKGMSSSKAHKRIDKIRLYKEKKQDD